MAESEGIRIACLYSLGCPELKALHADGAILSFLNNPGLYWGLSFIRSTLAKFDPFVFYQLVGFTNAITDFFRDDVVRAYWISNQLLRPLTEEDIQTVVKKGKIPSDVHSAGEIIMKIYGLIGEKPHHNFGVFQLLRGVKRGVQVPSILLEDTNNCLVRTGEVIEINQRHFKVKTVAVFQENGELVLKETIEAISQGFVEVCEKGDYVSIHFGKAREKLSEQDAESLKTITQEAFTFTKKGH